MIETLSRNLESLNRRGKREWVGIVRFRSGFCGCIGYGVILGWTIGVQS